MDIPDLKFSETVFRILMAFQIWFNNYTNFWPDLCQSALMFNSNMFAKTMIKISSKCLKYV